MTHNVAAIFERLAKSLQRLGIFWRRPPDRQRIAVKQCITVEQVDQMTKRALRPGSDHREGSEQRRSWLLGSTYMRWMMSRKRTKAKQGEVQRREAKKRRAEESREEQSKARAKQNKGHQGKAKQSRAKQSKAKQSKTKTYAVETKQYLRSGKSLKAEGRKSLIRVSKASSTQNTVMANTLA